MSLELFTDGSCSLKNPSPYGIAWAFCLIEVENHIGTGFLVHQESGCITTEQCGKFPASNNLAELIAVIKGLEYCKRLFPDEALLLFSDSEVTLKRIAGTYSLDKLPNNVRQRLQDVIVHYDGKLGRVLVKGHPTKKELAIGKSKDGKYPVSQWNVLVDKLAKQECKKLLLGRGD